jgi:hypothetical protein
MNIIHPIVEIRSEVKNEEKDITFISLDSKVNELSKHKSLFFTERGSLYKIDLSAVYNFMDTNSFEEL